MKKLSVLLLLASSVSIQAESGFFVSGIYGDYNTRNMKPYEYANGTLNYQRQSNEKFTGFDAGYRLNQYVGFKIGYKDFGKFWASGNDVVEQDLGEVQSIERTNRLYKFNLAELAVLLSYPVGDNFRLNTELGLTKPNFHRYESVSFTDYSDPESGIDSTLTKVKQDLRANSEFYWGAGASYKFETVEVGLSYKIYETIASPYFADVPYLETTELKVTYYF